MTAIYICIALATIALHEAGHIAAALSLGIRIRRIGVSWKGVYIVREAGSPMANLLTTVAGPIANLVVAGLCPIGNKFVLLNLLFGVSNLAPFLAGSDGQRAWNLLKKHWVSTERWRAPVVSGPGLSSLSS